LVAETPTGHDYADAVADFLVSLRVGAFDLLANSFGTRVAQCFAYYHPGRIGRAVFTGAGVARPLTPEERARAIEPRQLQTARDERGVAGRSAAKCPACRARRLRPPARGRGARARQ